MILDNLQNLQTANDNVDPYATYEGALAETRGYIGALTKRLSNKASSRTFQQNATWRAILRNLLEVERELAEAIAREEPV